MTTSHASETTDTAAAKEAAAKQTFTRHDPERVVRAPRGTEITAKTWSTEAAKRMLMNLSLIHI